MAYERLNLPNGTVLDETHLKHFEDGMIAMDRQIERYADVEAALESHVDEYNDNEQFAQRVIDSGVFSCGTEDLEAGVSELATGKLYFVYE